MVGYEFLLSKIPLRMPELDKPARIKPVTRVEEMADLIAIPKAIAPATHSILPHPPPPPPPPPPPLWPPGGGRGRGRAEAGGAPRGRPRPLDPAPPRAPAP